MLNEQLGYIMTANFTGASCVWEYIRSRDCFESRPSFSGHFNTVNGLAWNHTGDFLVSTSKDQTTRVYCENKATHTYNEISRAQIHGYDINTLALIPIGEKMIDLIACGADEKVIRVIEPPSSAANFLNCHTRANLHLYFESEEQ
jgi:elongator complex protein 2